MEKINPDGDHTLLEYLDGSLDGNQKKLFEEQLARNPEWQLRLEHLKTIHAALSENGRLESPSANFTKRIILGLDSYQPEARSIPRAGLMMLFGILVAIGIALVLLQRGAFDSLSGILPISTSLLSKNWISQDMAIPVNGKLILKTLMMGLLCLSFLLLDRTILRPTFSKRTKLI